MSEKEKELWFSIQLIDHCSSITYLIIYLTFPKSFIFFLFRFPSLHPTLPPLPPVENLQLSLVLQTENKGSLVAGGELNVCLDGLVVDLGSLPNGSTATDSESRLTTHIHTHTLTLTKKYTLFLMQTKCSHTHTLSLFVAFSISWSLVYIHTHYI